MPRVTEEPSKNIPVTKICFHYTYLASLDQTIDKFINIHIKIPRQYLNTFLKVDVEPAAKPSTRNTGNIQSASGTPIGQVRSISKVRHTKHM